MAKLTPRQNGFAFIPVIVTIVIILILAGFYFIFSQNPDTPKPVDFESRNSSVVSLPQDDKGDDPNHPPLLLKSIGVNLDYFDPQTGRAGDFEFTKNKLTQDRIWMDYGYVISAGMSASGKDKVNPQPTFILPMGIKVYSLVDGVVVGVPKLYSGDYSVQVASSENSPWRYETEHVINPVVKEGDAVKAGQVVGEVSPHDSQHNNGFGLVEIGILKGGGEGPPEHVCPFAYLDSSIKEGIQKKIMAFYKSWEEYHGDTKLYDEASLNSPGCLTLEPIEG